VSGVMFGTACTGGGFGIMRMSWAKIHAGR
jgi:hypothetical protein